MASWMFKSNSIFKGSWRAVKKNLTQPGKRPNIRYPANDGDEKDSAESGSSMDETCPSSCVEEPFMLRWLDRFVDVSGSRYFLLFVICIIIIWVVVGIYYKAPQNWQIVMQDGQSIQSYVWDTLLMRHQLTEHVGYLGFYAERKSKLASIEQAWKQVQQKVPIEKTKDEEVAETSISPDSAEEELSTFKAENLFDRTSNLISKVLGSLYSSIIYWIGIFIWLGCGSMKLSTGNSPPYSASNPQYEKWGNNWQLYINTATAFVILVTSIFLQNIRYRHEHHMKDLLCQISIIEDTTLNLLHKRYQLDASSMTVILKREKRNYLEKILDYYADVIGSGVGVIIMIIVFAVWIGIGHLMHWNSNWWLIIGTYTGLVGFFDGFVLRSVYYRLSSHEEDISSQFWQENYLTMKQICTHIEPISFEVLHKNRISWWTYKVSIFVNFVCSSLYTVLASVITIVGLICASSAMKWNTTGQLIANTPTMIIEGFLLLVLIEAHNMDDLRRRETLSLLLDQRKTLLNHFRN